jgi:hypothetical protein
MPTTLRLTRMLMRASILILLVLGLLFWSGHALNLLPVHMAFGLIFVLGLWVLAYLAARRGTPPALTIGAAVLGLAVLALGGMQTQLLPGDLHWLVRVMHLLLGLGAMGLAERLGRGAKA